MSPIMCPRTQGLLDEANASGTLTWQGSGGFSIDASVRIEGEDRAGVERLLRYCARPPFALERLHAPAGIASLASNDSRLVYRLSKPAPDGRTELRVSPLKLLERLARLIPPPRMHRHRYHGVLAPNAKLRAAGAR
jgi:putative transposase